MAQDHHQPSSFCFCTLAIGEIYRSQAIVLANDIEKFSTSSLVVLTDQPSAFEDCRNVQAFKHRQQSIGCYHDKRYPIAKALELYHACLFLDADMRILAEVPSFNWEPGITARSFSGLLNHNRRFDDGKDILVLATTMATRLDIALEEAKFINEFMFAVARDGGKEKEFIELWEKIGNYFELHGISHGEGNVIGMAAVKAGLPVRISDMPGLVFFKDKIELTRIKKEEVSPAASQTYFDQKQQLEFPNRSLLKKAIAKLTKRLKRFYYSLRLRIVTLNDANFYR